MNPSSTPLSIEFRILDARLRDWGLPEYQSDMAAAVDLVACLDAELSLAAGAAAMLVPAGFAMHIADPAIAAIIAPRSGSGHKRGLVLGNGIGVIDADYMGPVMISAWNRNPTGSAPIRIAPGERIAQMLFVPVLRPRFGIVESFSATSARGAGGFGSTGSGGAA